VLPVMTVTVYSGGTLWDGVWCWFVGWVFNVDGCLIRLSSVFVNWWVGWVCYWLVLDFTQESLCWLLFWLVCLW